MLSRLEWTAPATGNQTLKPGAPSRPGPRTSSTSLTRSTSRASLWRESGALPHHIHLHPICHPKAVHRCQQCKARPDRSPHRDQQLCTRIAISVRLKYAKRRVKLVCCFCSGGGPYALATAFYLPDRVRGVLLLSPASNYGAPTG